MKLLIVSDLHSNVEGIRAIWEKESGADAVYAAGDYVDYGTDPAAAIDWLREHHVHCVRGNHDDRLIRTWNSGEYHDRPYGGYSWVQHNCQRLTQEYVDFLCRLPSHLSFIADGVAYLMAHRCGQAYETIESSYQFDQYWDEHFTLNTCPGMERRMIFGHSHRQLIQRQGEHSLWLNPGSASYRRPDDPSKDAFYAVIENGEIRLDHTPYNRKPLYDEVLRMRSSLSVEEWRVADFFFGWTEADGPDIPWMEMCKARAGKA